MTRYDISSGGTPPCKKRHGVWFSKVNDVHSPMDSDSTSSTEVDSSFSKDSISSEEDYEIETPRELLPNFQEEINSCPSGWCHTNGKGRRRYSTRHNRSNATIARMVLLTTASLLVLCMATSVIYKTFSQGSGFVQWNSFLTNDAPSLVQSIRNTPTGSTFTIRLQGQRLHLLQQSLDAHSQCSCVEEVQVDFQGGTSVPASLLQHGARKAAPVGPVSTSGVLLLQEGVTFSCQELAKTFATWKEDSRRVVGFYGYHHAALNEAKDSGALSLPTGAYTLVSDRVAFVHTKYLEAFQPFAPLAKTACSTLLSLQVSLTSQLAPVLMKNKPRELVDSVSLQLNDANLACAIDWIRLGETPQELPGDRAVVLGR
eukprot:Nitzschia sp. Nitz4//scaffold75_size92586//11191//12303//NITZ4_004840-RA/size92586-processed-gene-0.24-mRNA-1//-1//CDS//3329557660//4124//frame0